MRHLKAFWGIIFISLMFCMAFSSAELDTNLVSYYNLNGTVLDSLGVNNGTAYNTPSYVTGKVNNAIDLETASAQYVKIGSSGGTLDFTTQNFSLATWIKLESFDGVADHKVISQTGTNGYALYIKDATGKVALGKLNVDEVLSTQTLTTGDWYYLVVTYDQTANKVNFYINGSLDSGGELSYSTTFAGSQDTRIGLGDGTQTLDGIVDEVGIWNRVLTVAEVTQLYNGGNGTTYPLISPKISLNSPVNATTISDVGTNFTATGANLSSLAATWKNVTFTIWNGSIVHNSTTVTIGSTQTFNQTLFIDEFVLGNYTWNAKGIYTNITGTYSVWANSNYTFNVVPFSVLVTNYSSSALEGSLERFSSNISVISTERMSTVNFVYNGTAYPVIPIEYSTNNWHMPYNLTIPEVDVNTNVSFYWSVRLESGLVYNTTSINQTIYNLGIDNCSTYTYQLFNLTMKDETLQNILVGATDNTSIKVDISISSLLNGEIINFSNYYNRTNPARVCLNYAADNSTVMMDAVIEFSSAGRFVEFYNIQDYIITNATQSQNISLYNLNSSIGQEYKVTYKGLDFTPVSNLIIQIQRKYIDEGVFKTIEIPMSGTNGYTIAHLVTNDVVYNLIFIKDGVILDTFTDVIATCQNPSFTNCEINLNALVGGVDLFGLVTDDDFYSSLSYNTATRTISSTFGILSGVSGNTTLEVYLLDNFGNTSVCSDSLIAAGGTLQCVVPESLGNSTINARIIYANEIRNEGFISMNQLPKELYSGILIFISIIMFMFLLGMAITDNPMIMGIFLVLGLFILIGLNMVYSTSWIGTGATVLWFIIAIAMILIKGGNKR